MTKQKEREVPFYRMSSFAFKNSWPHTPPFHLPLQWTWEVAKCTVAYVALEASGFREP